MKTQAKIRRRRGRIEKLNISNPDCDKTMLFIQGSVIERFAGITFICFNKSDDENFIYFDFNNDNFKIGDTSFKLDEKHCDKIYEMVNDFLENDQEQSESQINENYAELERSASIY